MSTFIKTAYLGYRGSFLWTAWRAWLANMVVRPVTYLMVFGVLHRELGLDATPSIAVALTSYCTAVTILTCSNSAMRIELEEGTFTVALTTPIPAWQLWVARVIAHVPNGVASAIAALVFAAIAFDVPLREVDGAVMLALVAVLASSVSLSMFIGVLTRRLNDWVGPVALTSGVLLCLSGPVVPRGELPALLRWISTCVPLAHANDALRHAFGFEDGSPWPGIAAEFAVAVALAAVALTVFAWSIHRARMAGVLTVVGT